MHLKNTIKVSMIINISLLIGLSIFITSCSLLEKEKMPKDDSSLNNSNLDDALGYSCTANITMEKIELNCFGKKFIYFGNEVEKSNEPAFDKVRRSFQTELDNDNLSRGGTEIVLKFSDVIPKSVTWDEYHIDFNVDFFFHHPNNLAHSVDNVGAVTVLPMGVDTSAALNSSLKSKMLYRAIRIVCEFENQTKEYNVFFDSIKMKGATPS